MIVVNRFDIGGDGRPNGLHARDHAVVPLPFRTGIQCQGKLARPVPLVRGALCKGQSSGQGKCNPEQDGCDVFDGTHSQVSFLDRFGVTKDALDPV